MAILAVVATQYGEERKLYIRLNNIEVNNHGVLSCVKFRGFLSKDAFEKGRRCVWEKDFEFFADINKPLWKQAYELLKTESSLSDLADSPD